MNTKLPNFGGTSASGNDSKYFQTTKKGALSERANRPTMLPLCPSSPPPTTPA